MSFNFNRFKKRTYQTSPVQTLYEVSPQRADGAYGQQLFYNGTADNWGCMKKAELTAIKTKVAAVASAANDTANIYIRDKKTVIHMSNMESTNVMVQIYHYKCIRDENQGPGAMLDAGLADKFGSGTYTQSTYGVTPFQSSVLCKTYKIQKVYALELGAGRSHIHTVKWKIDKFLDVATLTETDSDTIFMNKWTQGFFIIARGEPVNDNVETPVDSSVTASPTALDIITTERTNYFYGLPIAKNMYVTYSLPTSGLTNLTQMNEATGAETSVSEA